MSENITGKRIQMALCDRTVEWLSKKTGITVPTLVRYIGGMRVPKADAIVKISKALKVSCDYLIGLSEDKEEKKTMSNEEKYKLALFGVVRNNFILPVGIEQGRTEKVISQMTIAAIESMMEKVIDFDRMRECYELGVKDE